MVRWETVPVRLRSSGEGMHSKAYLRLWGPCASSCGGGTSPHSQRELTPVARLGKSSGPWYILVWTILAGTM